MHQRARSRVRWSSPSIAEQRDRDQVEQQQQAAAEVAERPADGWRRGRARPGRPAAAGTSCRRRRWRRRRCWRSGTAPPPSRYRSPVRNTHRDGGGRRRCSAAPASSCFLCGDRSAIAPITGSTNTVRNTDSDTRYGKNEPAATVMPSGWTVAVALVGAQLAAGGQLGDRGQVRAEEDGDDGGGEGRVGPVVEVPAGAFAAGARLTRTARSAVSAGRPSVASRRSGGGPDAAG